MLLLLIAFAVSACGREVPSNMSTTDASALNEVLPSQKASGKDAVLPKPAEQAQLDRMTLPGTRPTATTCIPRE